MYEHDVKLYAQRFKAFGFNIVSIDGHSIGQIVEALKNSKAQANKPTAVICRTEKGKGFGESIEGKLNWHGKDLGAEFDTSLQALKAQIKHENIQFKTYPPEGDDIIQEPFKVSITPEYNIESDIIGTRKAYGKGLLKAR